jgi:hypothetical protein
VQASPADKKRASKLPESLPLAARIVWVGVGPEKANPAHEGSARRARIEKLIAHDGRTVEA